MNVNPQPPVPEGWITLGQLKAQLQPILWPQGEPQNLIPSHAAMYVEGLIDLQMYCEPLKINNTSIIPWCATFFECGSTVVDCPRGIIRRVSTYDSISTKDNYPYGPNLVAGQSYDGDGTFSLSLTVGKSYYYHDQNDNGTTTFFTSGGITVPNGTVFVCGPTNSNLFQGTPSALITALLQADQSSTPGREDDNAPVNWCSEVLYTNVRYRMLRKFVDKALIYLNYPSGCFGCGIGLLLPAIAPVVAIFQQYAYCSKQPQTLYSEPSDDGFPPLPMGYHFAQKVTDAPNRAWAGVWAQERGRLYLSPWIQSSEVIVVAWDGLKLDWTDPDLIDNDPLIKRALSSFIRWKRFERHAEGPADVNYEQIYANDRADLIWRYKEETRRRHIEDSKARSANVTLEGFGTTTTTSTTTTSTTSTTTTSTTTTTASTTSTTTTTGTTTTTTSTTTTTLSTTTTSGEIVRGSVTPDILSSTQSCFGVFPAGNYKIKYLSGALQYTGGCGYYINSFFRLNSDASHGYRIIYNNGAVLVEGPGAGDYPTSDNYHSQSLVESHYSGAYIAFAHTGGQICMYLEDNLYSDNCSPGTRPTFQLIQVFP